MKKEPRARQFMYVQDLDHLKVKEDDLSDILNKSGALEWVYINHDKDPKKDEDGKIIRPHIHVVLKYENPQKVSTVANLFKDKSQYVDVWKGRIANAYSYLLHETEEAREQGKHVYKASEAVASFDFPARMKSIRAKITKSPKYISSLVDQYAEGKLTYDELEQLIGVSQLARRKKLIDQITELRAEKEHEKWLKDFKGKRMKVLWLYGVAGVGKTRFAEYLLRNKKYVILGSSRDYFQDYNGEHYIILNDLRPRDFNYSDLLRILDPYQHDKAAPSRYHDKKLNAEQIIITTPYSPDDFYKYIFVDDRRVDTVEQLLRRIQPLHITKHFIKKRLKTKKSKQDDQDNA
ncbi:Rep family protein [Lactobacillus gallinarum]|uniref:Rep family protein n=1 Tax=Lactobacillus gallinarum TaxID=52242 RepID=UPI00174A1FEA|nr:Rep family protein [Lactobacillus gallinarum]